MRSWQGGSRPHALAVGPERVLPPGRPGGRLVVLLAVAGLVAGPPGPAAQGESHNSPNAQGRGGPPVLSFSSYFGGSRDDAATAVAVDAEGFVYIAGVTASSDFPVTSGRRFAGGCAASSRAAFNPPCGDAFVAKIDPGKSRIVYSTYLGGSGNDYASAIAVDASGHAYVAGVTGSADFPVKDSLQPFKSGCPESLVEMIGACGDGFVAKLDPHGSEVLWSTFLGGSGPDDARGLALDGKHNLYVTGLSASEDFPVVGPLQQRFAGCRTGRAGLLTPRCGDAFVSKIQAGGRALAYSTFLGGAGDDYGNSISVDPREGSAYVAGATDSENFPLEGALQKRLRGGCRPSGACGDGFVAKIDPSGQSLAYSTYLGGSEPDEARRVAVDGSGNAHVVGVTASRDFPVSRAFQKKNRGGCRDGLFVACGDAFVGRLNAAGSKLSYSTYFGGPGTDAGEALAVTSGGEAVVGGIAGPGFPVKNSARRAFAGGEAFSSYAGGDGFAAVLDTSGRPRFSAYLGGGGSDRVSGIAAGTRGSIFAAGQTGSPSDFPTVRALPRRAPGGKDALVAGFMPGGGGASKALSTGSSSANAPDKWIAVRAKIPPHHSATRLKDGRVLLAGGCRRAPGAKCIRPTVSSQLWDPASGSFSKGPSMNRARSGHTATLMRDGKVLVAGECRAANLDNFCGDSSSSTELFDPAAGRWRKGPEMTQKRGGHAAASLPDGRVLVVGGIGGARSSAEIFDPQKASWSATAFPNSLHAYPSATALSDGRVLVAGGIYPGPPEVYDPGSDTWTEVIGNPIAVGGHSATLMKDGRVLFSGGNNRQGNVGADELSAVDSVLIYQPDRALGRPVGSFLPARPMRTARFAHTATLLPSGKVLVAAGSDTFLGRLRTAELYDPASGRWRSAGAMQEGRGGLGARGLAPMFSSTVLKDGAVLVAGGGSASVYDPSPSDSPARADGGKSRMLIWALPLALVAIIGVLMLRRRLRS